MKHFVYTKLARFFEKERGRVLNMAGLVAFSVLRPLYALDERKYSVRAQEATIALGRLEVLASILKRRLL